MPLFDRKEVCMEIERKFLVLKLPKNLEQYPEQYIEQAYLSTEPVIRVRRSNDAFYLTCKGKGLLKREEYEMPLSENEYQTLLKKAEGLVIRKKRYRIPWLEHVIELDVFEEPFAPLVVAEVEFSTENEAESFLPPDWFGAEVTYDASYSNAALSRRPVPAAEIRPGRYRHFKGNEYEVLGMAFHSETQEPMVVYQALYGERGIWVRPASMWNELVERDGKSFPRFTFLEDGEK